MGYGAGYGGGPYHGGGGGGARNVQRAPIYPWERFQLPSCQWGSSFVKSPPKKETIQQNKQYRPKPLEKNNSFPLRFFKANHDVTPSGKIQKIPSPFLWCSTSLYRAYAWGESRVCASHLWWPSSIMAGKIAGLIKGL